jgi:hypothetical protein
MAKPDVVKVRRGFSLEHQTLVLLVDLEAQCLVVCLLLVVVVVVLFLVRCTLRNVVVVVVLIVTIDWCRVTPNSPSSLRLHLASSSSMLGNFVCTMSPCTLSHSHSLSHSLTELNQTHGTPDVSSVKVNGIESTFEYSNYMEQPVLQSDGSDGGVRNLKAFNVFHKAASDACDEGALQINIPASLEVRSIVLQVLGMR